MRNCSLEPVRLNKLYHRRRKTSRKFQGKNKDLVNLKVAVSEEVYDKTILNKKGKPTIRKDIELYGRVDKGSSSFVTTTNLQATNHKYVEDTVNLPIKIKSEIINLLKNNNRRVAYLIKKPKKEE